MKKYIGLIFFLLTLLESSKAQNITISPLAGWWINTQYENFKAMGAAEDILYHISPWFLHIDTSGKSTIEFIYEQQAEIGYPITKDYNYGRFVYHYRKNQDIRLYTIKDRDSLLIFSNGFIPDAGIIF